MYIVLLIVVILIISIIIIYNKILSMRNKLLNSYSSLDVMLKKRYDLIPNVVEVVKEYKNYEKETLQKIINLRSDADNCNNVKDLQNINYEYNNFISDVNLLVESYPELKSSDNFIHLQKLLNDVEEHISAARRTYNAHVESYNTFISMLPFNLIAKIFNFKTYEFFKITDDQRNLNLDIR